MVAVRNSTATRQRLLDAAWAEFAERGLAGGRVNRIAEDAKANKQLIYAYFGSKEGLFDALIEQRLGLLVEAVPFGADDLPGYAGALFDRVVADPAIVRLTAWQRLERPLVSSFERASYGEKVAAIAAEQSAGRITSTMAPTDVMALVMGVVLAWSLASPALLALDDESDAEQTLVQRRRAGVVQAVQAMLGESRA